VISDGETAWRWRARLLGARRNQKIIEESASPVLGPEQTAELKRSAMRLAVKVGYRGACTVEFLYHPGDKLFAFLEVNTRLQVEHPITEITTAPTSYACSCMSPRRQAGGRAAGRAGPRRRGPAQTPRTPDRDFAPSPGRIARLNLPAGPGIRVDTGVSEGDTIPADFDSMIAKIIAYGRDRDQALARLRRAMAETKVIIEGGATNKSFVLDLLDQPEVIDASADTGWIDRVRAEGRLVSHRHSAVALAPRPSRATRKRSGSSGSACCPRRSAAARRCSTRAAVRWTSSSAASATGSAWPASARPASGWPSRPARTCAPPTWCWTGSTTTTGQILVNGSRHSLLTGTHGRSTWSRWTAWPTASAATRVAWSAPPRRRWSSPPRSRSATRSRPARRSSCWRA